LKYRLRRRRQSAIVCPGENSRCYTSELFPEFSRAAQWWLHSGIQFPTGGVARYYRTDLGQNHAISTEITGYAASTFVYLHEISGDSEFLDRARSAACFLTNAWDPARSSMPFEVDPAGATYFFDNGIIVRGLLAVASATGVEQFCETAAAIGAAMLRDFRASDGEFHPILSLPDKSPMDRDAARWSRSPGCYQLKSAMAWNDLAEATGDSEFRAAYDAAVDSALRAAADFLPGHSDQAKVMDRLHAFSYFLEGLLPVAAGCATSLRDGIGRVAGLLREIAPDFERSDVYAQLLRIRMYADAAGAVPLDRASAAWEADRLAGFQVRSDDRRIDGGFYFGKRDAAWLPYVNPVSTAFAVQALTLWSEFQRGNPHRLRRDLLI